MDKEKRKRRSWFERIRRLFTSSSDPKQTPKPADKKAKSKRWLPGKLRAQQSFALPAPFPGYMASTASAKAKFRSMSTPKERSTAGAFDAYSEHCFPFADRLLSPIPSMSPIPSIASDVGFARSTRPPVAQRSPRVVAKSPMTPVRSRSRRSPGHHSFGSEAALHQLQMEHYTPVR